MGSAALLAKAAAEAKARASKKGKSKDKSSYNQVPLLLRLITSVILTLHLVWTHVRTI